MDDYYALQVHKLSAKGQGLTGPDTYDTLDAAVDAAYRETTGNPGLAVRVVRVREEVRSVFYGDDVRQKPKKVKGYRSPRRQSIGENR